MKILSKILIVPIRFIYLIIGLLFCYMERAANWLIGFYNKTEYIKKGSCRQCGKCCRLLAIEYPRFFDRFPRLLHSTIRWHQYRYGFTYYNREKNYLLYRCNHLKADGSCKIYHFRPRLCREYPKIGLYGKPVRHLDCGFYFIRRDGKKTFDEALHEASAKKNK